jgi:nucleotide-binding universal stress UspA family protein
VNISSMLVRLETKLNLPNLAREILLLPPQSHHASSHEGSGQDPINFLVGYSNSHGSQLALDLTLFIALQTRLVVSRPVTVQVVYVVEEPHTPQSNPWIAAKRQRSEFARSEFARSEFGTSEFGNAAVMDRPARALANLDKAKQFEIADSILWQARCLADEWRGSLKTHLRFGDLATELTQVAQAEDATMLILGCQTPQDYLVRRLGAHFPCPILGVPASLAAELQSDEF